MADMGLTVGLIKALAPKPTDEQITTAVDSWLDDHPEATTTVEDGAITYAKLNSSLKETVDDVGELKTQINDFAEYIGLNLCGMDTTKMYPVYLPVGSYVTLSTADGLASSVAVPLYFYHADGTVADWYPLQANKKSRTIQISQAMGDVYFLKFYSVGTQNIMVAYGTNVQPYTDYDKGYSALVNVVKKHTSEIGDLQESTKKVHGRLIKGWADVGETEEKYIKANGQVANSEYCALTDYISVLGGDTISYSNLNCNLGGTTMMAVSCFDKDKGFISNAGVQGSTSGITGTYTLPATTCYIRIGGLSGKAGSFQFYEAVSTSDAITYINGEISDLQEVTQDVRGKLILGWSDVGETEEKYVKTNGQLANSEYCALSDYIRVLSGDTIQYSGLNCNLGGTVMMAISCYDENKAFMSDAGVQGSTTGVTGTYTLPDGVAYVRIGEYYTKRGTFKFYEAATPTEAFDVLHNQVDSALSNLVGKKIALFGDSTYAITGGGSNSHQRVSDYLTRLSGATISNFAIGGTWMSGSRISNTWRYYDFVELVSAKINGDMSDQLSSDNLSDKPGYVANVVNALNSADLSTYDIVIINYGTNDFAAEATFEIEGQPYSTDSFVGSIRTMIERIGEAYPNLLIVFNTPFWRCWDNPSDYVDDAFTHENGLTLKLKDYIDAINDIASGEYGLPVLNNLYVSGWNRYNMDTYFNSDDGTHFNVAGAKFVARRTFEFLNQQGVALGLLADT